MSHRGGTLDDRCQMCHERVYLLERHYTAGGHLYHRHCYRAAERTATLQKSKRYSDKATTESSSAAGTAAKIGVAEGADYTQTATRDATRDSKFPSNGVSSTVCSHNQSTSSLSTGLMKALYSTPNYRLTATAVTPAVSDSVGRVSSPVITSYLTPTAVSSAVNSTPVTSQRSITTPTSSSRQLRQFTAEQLSSASAQPVAGAAVGHRSAAAGARSQHLNAPAVSCTPSYAVGRTVAPVSPASSSGVLSRPLISSVTASDNLSEISTAHRTLTCSSSGIVATAPSVIAVCKAQLIRSSGVSTVTTSGITPHSSPFAKNSTLTATVTTSCVSNVPVMNSYTSSVKSAPITSAFRTAHVSPKQVSSAKKSVDCAATESAMVSSVFEKLAEGRERKLQTRLADLSAVRQSPTVASCSGSVAQAALYTGSSMTTAAATSNKTEWQLEAERRQAARKGVYVDPEKYPRVSIQQSIGQQQRPALYGSSHIPISTTSAANRLYAESRISPITQQSSSSKTARDGVLIDSDKYRRKSSRQQHRPGSYSGSHTSTSSKSAANILYTESRISPITQQSSSSKTARDAFLMDSDKKTPQQQIGQQHRPRFYGSRDTSTSTKSSANTLCADNRSYVIQQSPSSKKDANAQLLLRPKSQLFTSDLRQHGRSATWKPQWHSLQQDRFMSKRSASSFFCIAVTFVVCM